MFASLHDVDCALPSYICITLVCACNPQCCFLSGSITSHCLVMDLCYVGACVAIKRNNLLAPARAVHSVFWHIITGMDFLDICWVAPQSYSVFFSIITDSIPLARNSYRKQYTTGVTHSWGPIFAVRPMTHLINWCCWLLRVVFTSSILPCSPQKLKIDSLVC